ncbi:MAG: 3-hydroxyacyl-ACP dehydratase FabZ, partial [Pseudomonadota bacterium]
MDSSEIQKLIPHRYPFLLVDRVLELSEDRIVAIKNVSSNEPFFQGHFPGRPVMPGVLVVEAIAQASVLLASSIRKHAANPAGESFFLAGIDKAQFRRPVVPGDQL